MDIEHRRAAVARAATRIAALNTERDDDFQNEATAEIDAAQDAFRAEVAADLPAPHEDRLLDALMELQRSIDASPEAVREVCDAALDAAGGRVSSEASPATR